MSKVRVRFAPSPTGFLHIGGARTALFNWIFARQNQGTFLLRIEDTNAQSSSDEYVDSILDGLDWLGLFYDEDVTYQSQRKERHLEVAYSLREQGLTYYCQCPTNHGAVHEEAVCACEGHAYASGALRLKRPQASAVSVEDIVYGQVTVELDQLDDMIILRTDCTPTYLLSCVVDDYDMQISHIIRGVDHLTNAARQSMIYTQLGWERPVYVHLPLIHGPDGKKLSKRHGAVNVFEYKEQGYLPEALRNALIRMGWGYGDREFMTDAEMLELFSLDRIVKSKGQFAQDKLLHYNQEHMRQVPTQSLMTMLQKDYIQHTLDADQVSAALKILPEIVQRSKTLCEAAGALLSVLESPQSYVSEITQEQVDLIMRVLCTCQDWTASGLEQSFRAFADREGLKLVKLAQPLRIMITGQKVSPPVFCIMEALGKASIEERVKHCAQAG